MLNLASSQDPRSRDTEGADSRILAGGGSQSRVPLEAPRARWEVQGGLVLYKCATPRNFENLRQDFSRKSAWSEHLPKGPRTQTKGFGAQIPFIA